MSMAVERWRVFLDTSVIIAGTLSRQGASAVVLNLGEAEEIDVLISRHVLVEADRVLTAKFPELVEPFRLFIKNLSPELVPDPDDKEFREAAGVIDRNDALILAAAKKGKADYLISLDTRHFKTHQVSAYMKAPVLTPGEFLEEFRKFWEKV